MANSNQTVALLPMKAHSERVPKKNFRDFAGQPMFRWILTALLEVEAIDLVVINTDARELLAEHGLTRSDRILVRDRKPEIRGDLVSMNLVIQDDVENVEAKTYLMTHTTNPLLSSDTIGKALAHYQEQVATQCADSLFTVNKVQARFYRNDCSAVNHDPENLLRTQDLEPWFEENSNLYIFSRESFSGTNARIGRSPVMFETPRMESYDIDDQGDWDVAELIALRLTQSRL